MKKLGLGLAAILIAGGIYYFSAGSEKIAAAMKIQVDSEFASLKSQGFDVESSSISPKKEHFVLSFNDTEKIAAYFTEKGATLTEADAKVLKGLELGVDVTYLENAYSSVSFDVYPLTLPSALTQNASSDTDKKFMQQITAMLDKKVFLMHADINKLGSGFKGYFKDIDETIQAKKQIQFKVKALTFKGAIEDEKLSQLTQALENMTLMIPHEMTVTVDNMTSDSKMTGDSKYASKSAYAIASAKAEFTKEMNFVLKDLEVTTQSTVEKDLLKVSIETSIAQMDMTTKGQTSAFKSFTFNMDANNLPITAIEMFETLDQTDDAAMQAALKVLVSKGLTLNISDFSAKELTIQSQTLKGFKLNTNLAIDKSFNFVQTSQNPMAGLSAIDANIKLTLSDELFTFISQMPQALMLMMMIQPEVVNGEKVYKAALKDGKITVNGKPIM